ncbi:sigma-70 family RNA polymerase sigma factor [Nocardia sp. alder85J]|uniref:sigma-70 family RNA polymerase sigma factor n=1 Tax=Nocardia sp. alder85J TaxID=2862949 RepID=UPI001CD4050D|nr:sigma-70 family RNA polymerase sigma factor [Nocardia sp. alder85J]MCX4098448.1 sigma-70 family RNA polymerase sigma factor [Nocardia sp. alder85J]
MTATEHHRTHDLLARARAGDGVAFGELVEPYRRELHVHCYRMLGSVQDAEDLVQETLLAAWNGLPGFEARSSLRAWLYRIATNRSLNALRAHRRREPGDGPHLPEPTRRTMVTWLEPYPDTLLDDLPATEPGPEARLERKESVSLAFIAAIQVLPPRQRAVLVLRDVLGYTARETAATLDTTEPSVHSALQRARATLDDLVDAESPSPRERELADRFAEAFTGGDVDGIVALLTDDAWLRMPPLPVEYQGRAAARDFLRTVAFHGAPRYRLIPTRANGQPAYGVYACDPTGGPAHAHGLDVLTVTERGITAITHFTDTNILSRFGLPRTLHD